MKLRGITKTYHNKHNIVEALKDINLEFNNNGITTILGPSGCGKTTLLNIIAGKDKDFTGEVIGDESIEMIEQEFMLFETLSVKDNLLIICDDVEKIEELLNEFDMLKLKDKLIKTLSNGQKKRVQIIRSLLVNPDILLCDEPTASLDHENIQIIMNMLKKMSKEKCVIIVTHDIAVAREYSDYIITMDDGEIVNEEIICECKELKVHNYITKNRCFKNYLHFHIKNIKSRAILNVVMVILMIFMSLSFYFVINMFETIEREASAEMIQMYGKNIVSSTPKQTRQQNDKFDYKNMKFDLLTFEVIENIVEQVPEIKGYTFGINQENYAYLNFDEPNESENKWNISSEMIDFTITHICETIEEDELYLSWMPKAPYLYTYDGMKNKESAIIYQLTDHKHIELLYGDYCQNNNETVVDKELAKVLCQQLGIDDIKLLVDKEVNFYSDALCEPLRKDPELCLKVTGITNTAQEYEYQLFVKDEVYKNFLTEQYHIEEEKWLLDYVDFLVDPDVNIEMVVEKINQIYNGENTYFALKNYKDISNFNLKAKSMSYVKKLPIVDTSSVLKMSFVAVIGIMVIYFAVQCFLIKRKKKENEILRTYGYRLTFINILKNILFILVAGIILFICGPMICEGINGIMRAIYKEYDIVNVVVNFDGLKMFISLLICFVFVVLEEGVIDGIITKKCK